MPHPDQLPKTSILRNLIPPRFPLLPAQLPAVNEPVAYSEPAAKADIMSDLKKRSLVARGVNDLCSHQPDGYGPKLAEDTAAAFLAFSNFSVC